MGNRNSKSNKSVWRILSCVMLLVFQFSFFSLIVGCSGQYKGMPREAVLAYQTNSTYGELHALAVAYAESINAAIKEDTLHPGMYADYGVTLALMGHRGTACRMLNAEVVAFPESRGMVRRIKQHLLPDMMNDTLAPLRDTANIGQLLGWAYDSLTALMPLPQVASVIDSSDTAWIRQQTPVDSVVREIRLTANQKRELLFKQQRESELRRQAVADSISNAKQAKIDACKQAKIEKEKAKKQKGKEKAQADKEKKKQERLKQKEREQMQAEKQKEQQRLADEKKKQKEQETIEKQQKREQEAAEKKAQREQETEAKKAQRELDAMEKKLQREQEAAEKKAQREQEATEKKAQREQEAAEKKAQREQEAAEKKAQREQEAAEKKAQREQEAAERKAQREQQKKGGGEQ